jgi:hypothetical protein
MLLNGDRNLINLAERLVTDFVRGNLRIGNAKLFEDPKLGGLGLFKVQTFLQAQCCTWVKRAGNLDELWKINLISKTPGSLMHLRKNMFNVQEERILWNIANSHECFNEFYTRTNGNLKKNFYL